MILIGIISVQVKHCLITVNKVFLMLLVAFVFFAAAIIRKIYLRPGTGVGALQKRFGGCFR